MSCLRPEDRLVIKDQSAYVESSSTCWTHCVLSNKWEKNNCTQNLYSILPKFLPFTFVFGISRINNLINCLNLKRKQSNFDVGYYRPVEFQCFKGTFLPLGTFTIVFA